MHSTKEEKFSSIHKPVAVGSHQLLTVGTTHISKLTDDQLIKEFLSGSYCFHGVRNNTPFLNCTHCFMYSCSFSVNSDSCILIYIIISFPCIDIGKAYIQKSMLERYL